MAKQWTNAEATQHINTIAKNLYANLIYTDHAEERMDERGITTGDIMQVLKRGYVLGEIEPATRGRHKYPIEGLSPNSPRTIRLIVIAKRPKFLKIITVMWKDET